MKSVGLQGVSVSSDSKGTLAFSLVGFTTQEVDINGSLIVDLAQSREYSLLKHGKRQIIVSF